MPESSVVTSDTSNKTTVENPFKSLSEQIELLAVGLGSSQTSPLQRRIFLRRMKALIDVADRLVHNEELKLDSNQAPSPNPSKDPH